LRIVGRGGISKHKGCAIEAAEVFGSGHKKRGTAGD
jgi:hypothetical protein